MKRTDKWIAIVLVCLMTVSVTACGSHDAASDELGNSDSAATEMSASAETDSPAGAETEENASGDTTEDTGAVVDDALPEELEEGEIVLDNGDTEGSYTETTIPEKTVDFNDDKLGELYVENVGIDLGVYPSDSVTVSDPVGALTIDEGNSPDFTDPNTVLHGDLTEENSAVAALQNYGDPGFFEEHPYLYLYEKDETLEFRVFAAYTAKSENILTEHDFYDETEFSMYIQEVVNQRDMTAVTDPSLAGSAIAIWRILTIELDAGNGEDFLIQATITGVQR